MIQMTQKYLLYNFPEETIPETSEEVENHDDHSHSDIENQDEHSELPYNLRPNLKDKLYYELSSDDEPIEDNEDKDPTYDPTVGALKLSHGNLLPSSYEEAINHPDSPLWQQAMDKEIHSLQNHHVWDLTELPEGAKAIKSKWIFSKKMDPQTNQEIYKARLVALGCSQEYGTDYTETFSPVMTTDSFRTLLAYATMAGYEFHHFDVETAFLYGKLSETIYMTQPPGYQDDKKKTSVCILNQALYGLKQSGLHVDDMIIINSDPEILHDIIQKIRLHFKIKESLTTCNILGIENIKEDVRLILKQENYINKILQKYNMQDCKHISTPLDPNTNLDNFNSSKEVNKTQYQELIGSLLYLSTKSRPDIAFAVTLLSRYNQNPREMHMSAGYIIRLETSRISLSVTALKLTLKYWLQVLNMSSDRLPRICFNRTRELSNASGTPIGFIKKLTNLLNNNGSPALVSCDDPETLRSAITGLLKTAADQSIQNDLTRMEKSKLYSHYKNIHISFMTEGYLLGDFPFPVVRLLAQKCIGKYILMKQVYGTLCLSKSNVFIWHKRFSDGRNTLEDDKHTGRPSSSKTPESIEKVREFVANNRSASLRMMTEVLHINKEMIRTILHEDLGKTKVCAKFVPHTLTGEQKSLRIAHCRDIISAYENDSNFLKSIVKSDETWCFQLDPKTKRQSAKWKSKNSRQANKKREKCHQKSKQC
ncbi:hypothetical protein LAZ67_7002686 [Cordylochernes scorpioides]|uniref:Reverse transcriptase Ty1/copia-type domain-containing protein n=1 Tax=Cordylochernes scorpioides TaxID=51811 RepID=A0ABY6KNC5_9ARAC|nr:hypothetical protein LAZ67_7002686 [Cordylochernes scorpioides]